MTSVCCVQAHERDFDESYAEVQAIYELVAEYALPVAALDMAAFHTLVPDYTAMRHAIDEVESAQDEQAQSYAMELASGDVPALPTQRGPSPQIPASPQQEVPGLLKHWQSVKCRC